MKFAIVLALTLPVLDAQTNAERSFSQIAPLDGDWKVSPSDDPRFAVPDFDDSAWRTVRVPGEDTASPQGTSWIRFRVQLPGPLAAEPLAVLLPPLGSSYDLFVNGEQVGPSASRESLTAGETKLPPLRPSRSHLAHKV